MTGGSGKMQNHWTKDDIAAAWQRFERTYAHDPVAYRFLCGHCIQDETEVHQKNKVLPKKDEAIAEFSCKR